MANTKLLRIGELPDGTIRLQSQLLVGRDEADFIMEAGVLKCYGYGNKGFDFYEYKEPYTIVINKSEMRTQEL